MNSFLIRWTLTDPPESEQQNFTSRRLALKQRSARARAWARGVSESSTTV